MGNPERYGRKEEDVARMAQEVQRHTEMMLSPLEARYGQTRPVPAEEESVVQGGVPTYHPEFVVAPLRIKSKYGVVDSDLDYMQYNTSSAASTSRQPSPSVAAAGPSRQSRSRPARAVPQLPPLRINTGPDPWYEFSGAELDPDMMRAHNERNQSVSGSSSGSSKPSLPSTRGGETVVVSPLSPAPPLRQPVLRHPVGRIGPEHRERGALGGNGRGPGRTTDGRQAASGGSSRTANPPVTATQSSSRRQHTAPSTPPTSSRGSTQPPTPSSLWRQLVSPSGGSSSRGSQSTQQTTPQSRPSPSRQPSTPTRGAALAAYPSPAAAALPRKPDNSSSSKRRRAESSEPSTPPITSRLAPSGQDGSRSRSRSREVIEGAFKKLRRSWEKEEDEEWVSSEAAKIEGSAPRKHR